MTVSRALNLGNFADDGNALQLGCRATITEKRRENSPTESSRTPLVVHGGVAVGSGEPAGDPEGDSVGSGGTSIGGRASAGGTVG